VFAVTATTPRSCPACGAPAAGPALTLRSSRGVGRWRRCPRCASYFIDEPYAAATEGEHQAAMYWGEVAHAEELNAYKRRMFDAALRLIAPYAPPPASLLDVGCSFGGFLVAARTRGYRVSGIDVNPRAVDYAKGHGFDVHVAARVADATAPDPLDAITCFDTNYYWDDQPGELRAAYARLRPGGVLAIRTSDKSMLVTVGRALGPIGDGMVRFGLMDHRLSMPLPSLLRVMREAGFEVIHASPRHAVQSDDTRPAAKLAFAIGALFWERFGLSVGPGSLVVARKPG